MSFLFQCSNWLPIVQGTAQVSPANSTAPMPRVNRSDSLLTLWSMNGPALVSHSRLLSSAPNSAVTNTASQGELCARKEVVNLVRRSGVVTSSIFGANPTLA